MAHKPICVDENLLECLEGQPTPKSGLGNTLGFYLHTNSSQILPTYLTEQWQRDLPVLSS